MTSKEHVQQTAERLVSAHGLINLTQAGLCEKAGIAPGSFQHIMGCNFTALVDVLRTNGKTGTTAHKKVKRKRTNPALRKDNILDAAVVLAARDGYGNLTRDGIAEKAGVSCGLITHYFTSMQQLKRAVLRRAIKDENLAIISQALVNHDPLIEKLPPELKTAAAQSLAT